MRELLTTGKHLVVVDYILYIFLIAVTCWTVYQIIKAPVKERINHLRYRSKLRNKSTFKQEIPLSERSAFYRHIYFLLESVSVSKKASTESISVINFIAFSILFGILTLILLVVKFQDAFLGVFISAIVSLLPYTFLWVRLKNMRNTVGNQLPSIVEVLIQQYSASGDMYQALKSTHLSIQEPELKRLFVRLISDLQTSRNEEELRVSVDLFIYTCGNSWAMRIGNIILKSYLHQENVLNALLQLQNQMVNNEKMLEQEKAGSYDAFANAILTIILLPVSLVGAKYVTRPQSWYHLQFEEKGPLLLFILSTVFTLVALLVGFLIRKPKNDL
jgi:Flp pilus assembly protein TadB